LFGQNNEKISSFHGQLLSLKELEITADLIIEEILMIFEDILSKKE